MEMQQIRYYVALTETLNFTRAAEQCNVSQPALTRAIQQLEYELGGPLVRREGRNSHLTELGTRMLPLLRQCYDSALSAKELATSVKKGERSRFSLGVAGTFDVALLLKLLLELQRQFPGMRLRLRRGNAAQIEAMLKAGEVELAISEPLPEDWERLDRYLMFTECFDFIVGNQDVDERPVPDAINEIPVLVHRGAVNSDEQEARLAKAGIDLMKAHHVDSCRDLEALVLARLGIGIAPTSALQSDELRHIQCENLDLRREIAIYSVSGRRRSREGTAFLSLARSADWSRLEAA
jgi:DNA-binding transcriptional LysR family regulator